MLFIISSAIFVVIEIAIIVGVAMTFTIVRQACIGSFTSAVLEKYEIHIESFENKRSCHLFVI